MAEVVLRRIQAGIETTRGTAVTATRKVYGTMSPTRAQDRRYAVEDRGNFVDKFRGNPKLIVAGFSLDADATFEDMPFYASLYLNGGAAQTGSATVGYTWAVAPDVNSDTLKTVTLEVGDESVAWQGAFSTVDSAEFNWSLDDALKVKLAGFTQDWIPATSANLATGFVGFTGSIAEHIVESVMGWQSKLFIDPTGAAAGTTAVNGRLKDATWGIKNQNKPKYFGDSGPRFTRLGRGRRQTNCQVTFEGLDTAQYADFYNNTSKVVRIGLAGSAITGTTFGTTSGALVAGTPITAITTTALTSAIPGGVPISLAGQIAWVTPVGAASAATSIPIQSFTPLVTIPTATTVMQAKAQMYDFYGVWENFVLGNVDTNTTFQMNLQAMYDATAAIEHKVTIINGQTAI